jgi:hypothetical protein
VTKVGCNQSLYNCNFPDAPNVPAGQASLHIDLRNNPSIDPGPPNVAVNGPASVSNLTNNFAVDVVTGNETIFNPVMDPADVHGFSFDDGTSELNFTSVELFDLPTTSALFKIYVDVDGKWVFEANSAANLPYTFQEFGGVDAFQVLFNTPLTPTEFDKPVGRRNIRLKRLIRWSNTPLCRRRPGTINMGHATARLRRSGHCGLPRLTERSVARRHQSQGTRVYGFGQTGIFSGDHFTPPHRRACQVRVRFECFQELAAPFPSRLSVALRWRPSSG